MVGDDILVADEEVEKREQFWWRSLPRLVYNDFCQPTCWVTFVSTEATARDQLCPADQLTPLYLEIVLPNKSPVSAWD